MNYVFTLQQLQELDSATWLLKPSSWYKNVKMRDDWSLEYLTNPTDTFPLEIVATKEQVADMLTAWEAR